MKVLSRLGIVVGSLILAVLVFMVSAPRTVHAVAAALVQVTNTISSPVPMEEALGTATVLDLSCAASSAGGPGAFAATCTFFDGTHLTPFSVPSGQRAVLEYVDGNCTTPSSATIGIASLNVTRAPLYFEQHYLPVLQALPVSYQSSSSFATPIRLYLDAGQNVSFGAYSNEPTGITNCTAYISGRLVPTK